jgi:hypothetical protein
MVCPFPRLKMPVLPGDGVGQFDQVRPLFRRQPIDPRAKPVELLLETFVCAGLFLRHVFLLGVSL